MRALFCSIILIFLFGAFCAPHVYAKQTLATRALNVTARVPVSPQFAFVVRKNSTVDAVRIAPKVGDIVQIHVHLLGAQHTPLSLHQVRVVVRDAQNGEEILQREETTDILGEAVFDITVSSLMQKALVANFFDISYDEIIALRASLRLEVQQPLPEDPHGEQGGGMRWVIDMYAGVGEWIDQAPACCGCPSEKQSYVASQPCSSISSALPDIPHIAARDGPPFPFQQDFCGNRNECTDQFSRESDECRWHQCFQ